MAVLLMIAVCALAALLLRPGTRPQIDGLVTGPAQSLTAPVDGRVTRILTATGEHVVQGADLFELMSGTGALTRVTAPQSAVLGPIDTREGAVIAHGERLATLIDCDHLALTTDAAAAAALGIVANTQVRIRFRDGASALTIRVPSAQPQAGRMVIPIDSVALQRLAGPDCPAGRHMLIQVD
jgi:multidrug resistance efflux pump